LARLIDQYKSFCPDAEYQAVCDCWNEVEFSGIDTVLNADSSMQRNRTAGALTVACVSSALLLSGQTKPMAVPPTDRSDAYKTILWSTDAPLSPEAWPARVREAGYDAIPLTPGLPAPAGVGYYVENLVAELAFLHARKELYDRDWKSYAVTRDKQYLIRKPCFDDPAFWNGVSERLAAQARRYAHEQPLLYDLRDEASIGAYTNPMDYCFCPHTLRAFREWLKTRYSSLAALNAEWNTQFTKWDDVTPMTTFEIKQREKTELAGHRAENFAPWADHREYMDISFARAIDRLRSMIRKYDRKTPVGIEGTQMPSAWGGYDLWRLSQVVDWVEPYDLNSSRAMFGSFLPATAQVFNTYSGGDMRIVRRTAWLRLLDGDAGAIVWDDSDSRTIQKTAPGMPITQRGKDFRELFTQIKPAAAKLAGLRRTGDGIAIHYSQASIRAHWMFDSREDGDKWLQRLSPYEREHSRLVMARESAVKVVEDLGLTPDFVSYEQIEKGELTSKGYKVLILTQSVALSAAECRNIEAFARAGGVVIADNMAATMDKHGRRLAGGQLDALFGIRQTSGWKPVGDGPIGPSRIGGAAPLLAFDGNLELAGGRRGTIPDAPMVVRNGSAFYLNLDMRAYPGLRLSWPRGANYVALFRRLFAAAGIEAPVKIEGAHDILVRRYAGRGVQYIAFARNPKAQDGVEAFPDTPVRLHVTLRRQARVSVGGRDLGVVRELDVDLDPWQAALLELRPAS
jgi:hypothetical protein